MTALKSMSPHQSAEAWLDNQLARGRREVFSVTVDLGPELAHLLLQRNPENRPWRSTLQQYKTDMLEGRWEFNGETIVIAVTGETNDGQHRLRAVYETGRTIRVMMVFGVARDTRFTTDTGIAKTPGDLLEMGGFSNGNNLAAVAAYLWQIDHFGHVPLGPHAPQNRPTKQQVRATATAYYDKIEAAFAAIKPSSKMCSYSLAIASCLHIAAVSGDQRAAEAFIIQLMKGTNLDSDDPIFVARERMLDEKRRHSIWPAKAMEIIFRGWNMHRRGERPTRIQLMGEWPRIAR